MFYSQATSHDIQIAPRCLLGVKLSQIAPKCVPKTLFGVSCWGYFELYVVRGRDWRIAAHWSRILWAWAQTQTGSRFGPAGLDQA